MECRKSLSLPGKKSVKVLIHFPQQSAGPSSMSYYCDALAEGLTKLGYVTDIISKRRLIEAARPGLRRTLLTKTPAVISTWPELFRQRLKYPQNWLINISQEYIPPFAASRSINIIHDLIQIDYPRSRFVGFFYRRLLPVLARNAALNISVSNCTAAELAAMRVQSRVVYNEFKIAVDSPKIPREPASKKYAACWVGNLAKHKNIGDYLAAAAAMPNAAFAAIVPEGQSEPARSRYDAPHNVQFFHSLSVNDYNELLASCRFLVSTSLVEGFGRPPADGALVGCDLVLTDIPIYRELYDQLAHFYEPGDVAALVAILSTIPADIHARAHERFKAWNARYSLIDVIDAAISSAVDVKTHSAIL